MNNLALQIIDETIEETEQKHGFVVDNDNKAEWILKKLIEEKAETQRYINVCETAIAEYKFKIEQAKKQHEDKTSFLKSQLQQYFETVEHKKTKTQETYTLPSGVLKKKYPVPEFIRDDEKIIEYLKSDDVTSNFIKIKETVDWVELKKTIRVDGTNAISEYGEIIEGVTVSERPPVFEIVL